MVDDTIAGAAIRSRDTPFFGSCRHQHRARGRAGLAHRLPRVLHAGRAAGDHDAQFAGSLGQQPLRAAFQHAVVIGVEWQSVIQNRHIAVDFVDRRLHDTDHRQRHVEFFGHQHRQRGIHALPHFAARHRDRHPAVRCDLEPAIERDFAIAGWQWIGRLQALAWRHHAPADDQRAGDAQSANQESAAG